MPVTTPVLDLTDASFGYDGRPVVTGVDLVMTGAERLAVVGPNGSGKSTLVRGLLGLNDHLGGRVRLFGEPLAQFTDRHLLGYVPQRHTLSTAVAATASEIVASGRLPHLGRTGRLRRADRDVIRHCLDVVGLGDRADDEVRTFSGGQHRRVLIARALASEPRVLVMDEPTAGIDQANQHMLAAVLQRLVDRGVALLVVTHELGPLAPVLTRVVTVEAGRVRADVDAAAYLRPAATAATPTPGSL